MSLCTNISRFIAVWSTISCTLAYTKHLLRCKPIEEKRKRRKRVIFIHILSCGCLNYLYTRKVDPKECDIEGKILISLQIQPSRLIFDTYKYEIVKSEFSTSLKGLTQTKIF